MAYPSSTPVSSDSHSDNNNNKLRAEVIVAIVILLIIVFVTIIVAVIGITVFWKEKKSKHHTKEESVYYSTINEIKLQRTPQNKPDTVYSEPTDVLQVSKEKPCYVKTSKCVQPTIAENVILQDNPSYCVISGHHVKIEDNPSYSSYLYHQAEVQDHTLSHSEQQDETKACTFTSEHQ